MTEGDIRAWRPSLLLKSFLYIRCVLIARRITTVNSTGKIVVLVVEDEPLIRMDVADYVSETGFETLEAATGDEALSILCGRDDIDGVFTDVNMPGRVDGLALARTIAE